MGRIDAESRHLKNRIKMTNEACALVRGEMENLASSWAFVDKFMALKYIEASEWSNTLSVFWPARVQMICTKSGIFGENGKSCLLRKFVLWCFFISSELVNTTGVSLHSFYVGVRICLITISNHVVVWIMWWESFILKFSEKTFPINFVIEIEFWPCFGNRLQQCHRTQNHRVEKRWWKTFQTPSSTGWQEVLQSHYVSSLFCLELSGNSDW